MKIGIIGAGLGGLFSAAILSKKHDITIYEKLPYIGGRFTNLDYKGYQLTTGALHMIPHGANGFFGQLVQESNCGAKIINSNPDGLFRINNTNYGFEELKKLVSFKDKLKALKMLADLKLGTVDKDISFGTFLEGIPIAEKVGNSFSGWALSLSSYETPIDEVIAISKYYHKFGGPGIPLGGCKGIIDALEQVILQNGGIIHKNYSVDKIYIPENAEEKCTINDENEFDIIISNASPIITQKISNLNFINKNKMPIPSKGIKVSIGSRHKLITHNSVVFTTESERLNGFNQPSNVDKSLAKEGHNLIMAHATQIKNNINDEIDLVLEDIDNLFSEEFTGHEKEDYKILAIQTYRDECPVNHASNGTDLKPVINDKLYLVGDGVKGKGGIEVEGVSLSVIEVLNHINKL
ncbi:phytoene dehydrogenase-like protein [Methanococcus voltae]|uniref:NAD(P)-binding protein n=1 Tax=Methanococcus voltae TaxID=2188 RepID=UPI001AE30933|nr:NAD(P)-binding protein [Methanococcus voltae]MBP2143272.1 phytoene dehydrogenase-like protein [Methanococcus voltae]